VDVGETFNREVWTRAREAGKDGFGENGEFHTLAKVWEAPGAAGAGAAFFVCPVLEW
jgi:hypothetical protein